MADIVVVNEDSAMSIPAVKASIEYYANRIASLNVKLYKRQVDGSMVEVENDTRCKILNRESGGIISSYNCKYNQVKDYLLLGKSMNYIERTGVKVKSIRYVKPTEVSVMSNTTDSIFRQIKLNVNGKEYYDDDFILLMNTQDAYNFKGLVTENKTLLESCLYMLRNNRTNAKTANVTKGVVESSIPLSQEEIDILKSNWEQMYSGDVAKTVILNEGLSFKGISNTLRDNMIVEQQQQLDEQIYGIFGVSKELISGKATAEAERQFLKNRLYPLLDMIRDEYNRVLLTLDEKDSHTFVFDVSELAKESTKERYEAYNIAVKNNILTINECRLLEKLPIIKGLEGTIKLGLQDVLYNLDTQTSTVLNLGKTVDLGGEIVKYENAN